MEKQYLPELLAPSRISLKKLSLEFADKMVEYNGIFL